MLPFCSAARHSPPRVPSWTFIVALYWELEVSTNKTGLVPSTCYRSRAIEISKCCCESCISRLGRCIVYTYRNWYNSYLLVVPVVEHRELNVAMSGTARRGEHPTKDKHGQATERTATRTMNAVVLILAMAGISDGTE